MRLGNICPICNSRKTKLILHALNGHADKVFDTKTKFQYDRCQNCGGIFLIKKRKNKKYYESFYSEEYRNADKSFIDRLGNIIVALSDYQKIQLINKSIQKTKKKIQLLDVGSGFGRFLKKLDADQFDAFGLEIDKDLITESRDQGLSIFDGDFFNIDFGKKKFDCITLWHVIEHIDNPKALLEKINKLLSKEGIVVFSTPNTDSIGFQKGKEYWFHLDAPRHQILYNRQSLTSLAEKFGFEVLEIKNNFYEFPTDIFYSLKHISQKKRYYVMYPYYKYTSRETMTYVWKKI